MRVDTISDLWIIMGDPHDRDGYALKPIAWEGGGQYRRVRLANGRDGLLKDGGKHLPALGSVPVGVIERSVRKGTLVRCRCHNTRVDCQHRQGPPVATPPVCHQPTDEEFCIHRL